MSDSKQILPMQRTCAGACEHTVKATRIGDGWNVRVFLNGVVNQEVRVTARNLIGAAAQDMLRWEDKCGNLSDFADSARHRVKSIA